MRKSIWSKLFGNASPRQVKVRVLVDFTVANVVLIVAAILRLAIRGELDFADPVNQLADKITVTYLVHAGWFALSAGALLTWAGIYRPLPSSRIGQRLVDISKACGIGMVCHLVIGSVWQGRVGPTLEVAVPAWSLLGVSIFAVRYSTMSLTTHYRVVPRKPRSSVLSDKVEDVLVVGGAGYIGSVLTKQLLEKGYRVRVLDMGMFGHESLQTLAGHSRLEIISGDFRNVEDVVRALRNIDAVVHLAAIVGDPACALDKEASITMNYAAARMMAQLARANGVSRFVFASTCSVYGASDDIRTEESDLNPVSLYATTKIDAERALLETADDIFQPTILRFATAYGWSFRPRFDLVANLFSAQAVTDKHIRIINGEQWRPFVHTVDIARACVMAVEAPLEKVGCEVFNVGDHSQNYTLQQLGHIVADCEPGMFVEEITNDDDPRNYRVDFSKIQRVLDFRASIDLHEGVREMVEAVRAGKVINWQDPIYSNLKTLQQDGPNLLKFQQGASEEEELRETKRFLSKAA